MDGDCSRMALVVKRTTYSGVTVRVTKQPIHEATLERGTLEGRERKREIRMVEGPPGPGPPSVIEIYLAVISLFLPLRPSRSPYIKEWSGSMRRPMWCRRGYASCFDLEFADVLRTSELKGGGKGGLHGGWSTVRINPCPVTLHVDRWLIVRSGSRNPSIRQSLGSWLLRVIVVLAGRGMMGLTGGFLRFIVDGFVMDLYKTECFACYCYLLFIVIEFFTWIILSFNRIGRDEACSRLKIEIKWRFSFNLWYIRRRWIDWTNRSNFSCVSLKIYC